MPPRSLLRGGRPHRHHTVNPALIVAGIPRLVEFLVQTFEAVEVQRMAMPDGRVVQAEVTIDDSLVMIMAPRPGSPPRPCSLGIYVDDVDATYARALTEGARAIQGPADQFYGHRTAQIEDPAGNLWTLHTVIEALAPGEVLDRSTRIVQRKSN